MARKIFALIVLSAFLSGTAVSYAKDADVYVTKNGKSYHQELCPLISKKKPMKISFADAEEKNLKPCKKCFKQDSDDQAKLNKKEKTKVR